MLFLLTIATLFVKFIIVFIGILYVLTFIACFLIRKKYSVHRTVRSIVPNEKKRYINLPKQEDFDVIIVGAGPGGGTCAYFAAKGGLKVALIERKKFPRDKFCGNACNVRALRIISEMGLTKEFVRNNELFHPDSGGFVSPSGMSYIGKSVVEVGEPLVAAIKRDILDMRIATNAEHNGATLIQSTEVCGASFNIGDGMWEIIANDESLTANSEKKFRGRVLVCADGATSNLACKLGYVNEPPKGISSRCYVESGTHNAKLDGICAFPPFSLPGYCAILKQPKDELNFCYYLLPIDGKMSSADEHDLCSLHKYALEKDPFISRIIGPNATIESMKVAPLRVACQGVKTTYDNNFLIVGDAAGFTDPITGEGIHNAMMSGKAAALTVLEMNANGNFSRDAAAQYEDRWMIEFGYDLNMSKDAAKLILKFPFILDGCCDEMHRGGEAKFVEWAKIMTMYDMKEKFLDIKVAFPLLLSILKFCFKKFVLSYFIPSYNYQYPGKWKKDIVSSQ